MWRCATPECYEILPERRLLRCRIWGVLTNEELIGHYRRIRSDPAFDPTFAQLGDLRDVTEFSVGTETVQAAADLDVFAATARRALVVTQDVQYGVARMFATFSELAGHPVRVFRDYHDAEEWVRSDARSGTAGHAG